MGSGCIVGPGYLPPNEFEGLSNTDPDKELSGQTLRTPTCPIVGVQSSEQAWQPGIKGTR